jgi:hypothetical protein
VFGNDFEHPIKDRLPPGFNTAFKIVKWGIDPGLEGDFYADKPYLYGPLLSSINVLRVAGKAEKKGKGYEIPAHLHEDGLEEGADGDGDEARKEMGLPEDAAARKKWALQENHRAGSNWEEGRVHRGDFFNPYLDFNGKQLSNSGINGEDMFNADEKYRICTEITWIQLERARPSEWAG